MFIIAEKAQYIVRASFRNILEKITITNGWLTNATEENMIYSRSAKKF